MRSIFLKEQIMDLVVLSDVVFWIVVLNFLVCFNHYMYGRSIVNSNCQVFWVTV